MTFQVDGQNVSISLNSNADFVWYAKAIGEPFALRDDLAGVPIPPTDNADFRYIKLTAGDAYNAGVLTSEAVAGAAPLVVATAVISLTGSPINGRTINLLNTERRFLRAGASGTLEHDAFQGHQHSIYGSGVTAGSSFGLAPAFNATPGSNTIASNTNAREEAAGANGVPRTGDETRVKNQGVTMYMRIK